MLRKATRVTEEEVEDHKWFAGHSMQPLIQTSFRVSPRTLMNAREMLDGYYTKSVG